MQTIGVIGGLSWVSTAEYYRLLNEITNEVRGGVHSAPLVMASVDRQLYVNEVRVNEDEAAACEIILGAAKSVEQAGAAFIVISCNDVHRFVPEVEPHLSIPFLHIAEATAESMKELGVSSALLMGVKQTMEGSFYPSVLTAHGIETVIPAEDERKYIDDTIMDEMVKGRFLPDTKQGYIDLIEKYASDGVGGAILGCTEIPILMGQDDTDVPVFSTTDLHCRAAVERALLN